MSGGDENQLTRDIAPFGVRMPADLKERVQAAAKRNNRSTNAEIVATLEAQYPAVDDQVKRLHLALSRSQAIMRELSQLKQQLAEATTAEEMHELDRRHAELVKEHEDLFRKAQD